ncbi:MAG: ABC transporter ATP-binding protein [Elusimicrobiota bacterium]
MLDVRDLIKVYGEGEGSFTALRGLSFSVGKGEFISVMGPSGCGKSTMLNVLGLMDRPTSGTYIFDGQRVERLGDGDRTRLRREKIGFVFQSFNLLPRMTALQNVCLPMGYAGVGRRERLERGQALLARVGLGEKAHRTPLELSGGERQRVGIARALANRPVLLMADEPTGNLDSKTAMEILDLFSTLHGESMTILLVTHDKAVAARSQRVLHIMDGKVVREEPGRATPNP